ncbi:hypothetical protein FRB95_001004 [Tulasnella sp. JGI-2019a]|nr:hypothetical protein FRB95_001004 [Tulasnella sp. JGI-2019a]
MANSVDHCEVICRLDPSPWSSQSGDPLYEKRQTEDDSGEDEGGAAEPESGPVSSKYGPLPFSPLPSNRIIVLTLRVIVVVPMTNSTGSIVQQAQCRSYAASARADTLLGFWRDVDTSNYAPGEQAQVDSGRAETFAKVPWEAWGSKHSRFLAETTDANCICHAYGLRYCRRVYS